MNEKPLLLVCTKEKLKDREVWLKSRSEIFWEDQYITLSTLPVNIFDMSFQKWIHHVEQVRDSLKCEGSICTDADFQQIIYNGFENSTSEIKFSGKGADYQKKGEIELFNEPLYSESFSGKLEISFWMFVDTRIDNMPKAVLNLWDADGQLVEKIEFDTRGVHNVYDHWVRIATVLEFKSNIRYQLIVKGKYITIDDLLIKPEKANVLVKVTDRFELYNNFPLSSN